MLPALLALMAMATPSDRLIAGELAMEALEYEMATYEFMSVAVDPKATEAQRLQAHLRAGFAHRVLGKDTDARLNFRYVLQRAPETRLAPDSPPKVFFFFESVRQEIEADRGAANVSVTTTRPASGPPAAAPVDGGTPPAFGALLVGGVLATGGALAAVTSGAFALVVEQQLGDPTAPGPVRAGQLEAGRLSLVVAGVGAAIGLAGGAVMIFGAAP